MKHPYELDQIRHGFCKCGGEITTTVHYWWELQSGKEFCKQCKEAITPTASLDIISENKIRNGKEND